MRKGSREARRELLKKLRWLMQSCEVDAIRAKPKRLDSITAGTDVHTYSHDEEFRNKQDERREVSRNGCVADRTLAGRGVRQVVLNSAAIASQKQSVAKRRSHVECCKLTDRGLPPEVQ
jgi:hypothetical protein